MSRAQTAPSEYLSAFLRQTKSLARKLAAFALYYSGLFWLYAKLRLRRRAVILMYHRVLPPEADTCSTDAIVVTPTTFSMHMAFLKRHFCPLTAQQLETCLARGQFPARSCLVTFDDGWFDNERYALPVLRHFQVPAIFFLATAYVGTDRTFWQEELTRLIVSAWQTPQACDALAELGIRLDVAASTTEARRLAREAVTRLKSAPFDSIISVRDRLVAALAEEGRSLTGNGDDYFMSWDQVRFLAEQSLVTVASHAHSHVPLTRLGRDGAAQDLSLSLEVLDQQGLGVRSMCAYPNGDHDANVVSAARSLGFMTGLTTITGHIEGSDDPMTLRRINVHQAATSTRAEFACRIIGLL